MCARFFAWFAVFIYDFRMYKRRTSSIPRNNQIMKVHSKSTASSRLAHADERLLPILVRAVCHWYAESPYVNPAQRAGIPKQENESASLRHQYQEVGTTHADERLLPILVRAVCRAVLSGFSQPHIINITSQVCGFDFSETINNENRTRVPRATKGVRITYGCARIREFNLGTNPNPSPQSQIIAGSGGTKTAIDP
jgi:hypothetical protein